MGKYDQGWKDQQTQRTIDEIDAAMWRDVGLLGKIIFGVIVGVLFAIAIHTIIIVTHPAPPPRVSSHAGIHV